MLPNLFHIKTHIGNHLSWALWDKMDKGALTTWSLCPQGHTQAPWELKNQQTPGHMKVHCRGSALARLGLGTFLATYDFSLFILTQVLKKEAWIWPLVTKASIFIKLWLIPEEKKHSDKRSVYNLQHQHNFMLFVFDFPFWNYIFWA